MKLYYDSQVDALYLELRTLQPGTATALDLTENVTANYAPDGQLAGIEILEGAYKSFKCDIVKINTSKKTIFFPII
ncbi:MAG: DUF2283 domain-containing protein [Candidatus Parabeggiatoa sp.]|nr:DUF2283 domain-containing protein [Candidatus Parabeggiatoa sp.]